MSPSIRRISERRDPGPGPSDATLLDQGRAENRILLTFDRDFGELIYRQGHPPPPALVYFRFSPTTPEEPAVVFQGIVARREIVLERRLTGGHTRADPSEAVARLYSSPPSPTGSTRWRERRVAGKTVCAGVPAV